MSDLAAFLSVLIGAMALLVSVGIWVGGVNSGIKELKKAVGKIQEEIGRIFERLPERGVVAGSPLRLTEKGKEMAALVDAEKWAADLVLMLLPRARGKDHWVIDQMCRDYVRHGELASDEGREWLRKSVGMIAFSFGTDPEDAQNVLQVVLRDAVLSKLADSGTEEETPF